MKKSTSRKVSAANRRSLEPVVRLRDRDILVLERCCKALERCSSQRMVAATLDFATDKYLAVSLSRLRTAALLSAKAYANRDWHRLSENEHLLVAELEALGYIAPRGDGFVGAWREPNTQGMPRAEGGHGSSVGGLPK